MPWHDDMPGASIVRLADWLMRGGGRDRSYGLAGDGDVTAHDASGSYDVAAPNDEVKHHALPPPEGPGDSEPSL